MERNSGWIETELPELVRNGVIDEATALRIRGHYGRVPAAAVTSTALLVCGVLGALLVGLGLILILAHNWDRFPRIVRLAMALAPLLGAQALAVDTLRRRSNSVAWTEGAALFLALAAASALALISQIFHFPGDLDTYVLVCSLLALPLVYVFDAGIVAALYVIGCTAWGVIASAHEDRLLEWLLLLALLSPYLRSLVIDARTPIRATLFAWLFGLLLPCGLIAIGNGWGRDAGLFPLALLASIFLLADFAIGPSVLRQRPFMVIGRLGVAGIAFYGTYQDESMRGVPLGNLAVILLAAIAIVLLAMTWRRLALELFAYLALPLLLLATGLLGWFADGLPMALVFDGYLLVLAAVTLRKGFAEHRLPVLNFGLLIIAALIVRQFFDSDWSFTVRGLAFMVVGAAFLGSNLWLRRRGVVA